MFLDQMYQVSPEKAEQLLWLKEEATTLSYFWKVLVMNFHTNVPQISDDCLGDLKNITI